MRALLCLLLFSCQQDPVLASVGPVTLTRSVFLGRLQTMPEDSRPTSLEAMRGLLYGQLQDEALSQEAIRRKVPAMKDALYDQVMRTLKPEDASTDDMLTIYNNEPRYRSFPERVKLSIVRARQKDAAQRLAQRTRGKSEAEFLRAYDETARGDAADIVEVFLFKGEASEWPAPLVSAAFAAKIGDVLDPVPLRSGQHAVARVLAHSAPSNTFEQVKPKLVMDALELKATRLLSAEIDRLVRSLVVVNEDVLATMANHLSRPSTRDNHD